MLSLVAVIAPWSLAGPTAVTHRFVASADGVAEVILANVVLDVTFTVFVTVLVLNFGRDVPLLGLVVVVVVDFLLDDLEAFGGTISVPFTFNVEPDTESSVPEAELKLAAPVLGRLGNVDAPPSPPPKPPRKPPVPEPLAPAPLKLPPPKAPKLPVHPDEVG
jgi:hypothetical protein